MLAPFLRAAALGLRSAAETPARLTNAGGRGSMLSPASLRFNASRYAASRFGWPGYRDATRTALTMLPLSPSNMAVHGARELGGFAPRIVRANGRVQRAPF